MAKRTKALSGASKDAFFKRLVEEEPLDANASARMIEALQSSVSSLRIRLNPEKQATAIADITAPDPKEKGAEPFDPFDPKVTIVLRTEGRESILEKLATISSEDHLRLLASEQQLSLEAPEDASLDTLREAIVTAAERRLANRRAAAR